VSHEDSFVYKVFGLEGGRFADKKFLKSVLLALLLGNKPLVCLAKAVILSWVLLEGLLPESCFGPLQEVQQAFSPIAQARALAHN